MSDCGLAMSDRAPPAGFADFWDVGSVFFPQEAHRSFCDFCASCGGGFKRACFVPEGFGLG